MSRLYIRAGYIRDIYGIYAGNIQDVREMSRKEMGGMHQEDLKPAKGLV